MISIFMVIAGPGIIVMVADNDAGGITTYTVTGALFLFSFIWIEVLLGPVAYICQEMTVRLGAITKRGHAEAIFDAFGSFWGWFSLLDLTLTDFLTITTEFIGMTAAMSIFGVSPIITVVAIICLIMAMVISGRYWTWEKLVLAFCVVNLIFIPAAFLFNVPLHAVLGGFIPSFPYGLSGNVMFFIMANIGTTIAPWMIFFQQSSVVDKGLQEKDINYSRVDTAIGSFFTIIVAVFCIIIFATLLPYSNVQSAAAGALRIMPINRYVGTAVAVGLFDAGLLGAICISLASAWAWGEVFGWPHSLNHPFKAAPGFYIFRALILAGAAVIVLIPKAPVILITLFVQVIAVTLLPAALTFLLLLLNQEEVVGKYKNSKLQNILAVIIIVTIIALSTLYAMGTIFPSLFG
jgi:Mn2+/Fe2+ NRAMP family transporter